MTRKKKPYPTTPCFKKPVFLFSSRRTARMKRKAVSCLRQVDTKMVALWLAKPSTQSWSIETSRQSNQRCCLKSCVSSIPNYSKKVPLERSLASCCNGYSIAWSALNYNKQRSVFLNSEMGNRERQEKKTEKIRSNSISTADRNVPIYIDSRTCLDSVTTLKDLLSPLTNQIN